MRIAAGLSPVTLAALAALAWAAPAAAQPQPAAPPAPPAAPPAPPAAPPAPPAAPSAAPPPAPIAAPPAPPPAAPPAAPIAAPPAAPIAAPPAEPAPPAPPAAPPAPPAGFVGTNPAGLPTAPVPPPPPAAAPPAASPPFVELSTLRLLANKGVISQAEYEAALKDLGDSAGGHAADSTTITFSKWKTTLYGYAQADMIYHSTQSFAEFSSNAPVARPETFAGSHDRLQASIRDSRFGIRIQAPPIGDVRTSAMLEMDFLGPTGTIGTTISESGFFNNPNLRVRHANLKIETPVVDILFGQSWHLFGWQPNYFPTVVQWPGLVGELFGRTTQLRLSRTFKTDPVNVEIAAAAMRPPQRDARTPEGEAGLRVAINKWTSWHTGYLTNTALVPASIAVSGDVRQIRMPEFSAAPKETHSEVGGGVALNAYLPIIPGSAERKDNSLSLIGEFVTGKGINDLYTALTGGVSHVALPNPGGATPAPEYTSPVDPGLAVYGTNGTLRLPTWTTFVVGAEYYLPFVGGRVAIFGNFSRSELRDASTYPNPAKVRDHEIFIEGGVFVDPVESLRFGVDYAHIEDVYADEVTAKNDAGQITGFFFF